MYILARVERLLYEPKVANWRVINVEIIQVRCSRRLKSIPVRSKTTLFPILVVRLLHKQDSSYTVNHLYLLPPVDVSPLDPLSTN